MFRLARTAVSLVLIGVLAGACSSGADDAEPSVATQPASSAASVTNPAGPATNPSPSPATATPVETAATDPGAAPPADTGATPGPPVVSPDGPLPVPPRAAPLACDAIDASACLLPWPNDAFTTADELSATGLRLAIDPSGTPANQAGVHIDVTDQNRADGFSPGSALLALIPDLDLAASGIPDSTDIGASLADDAPIVVVDATTGARWPYWAELDAQADDDDQRLLIIHPATSLLEGHRYVIAFRDLQSSSGPIGRSAAFSAVLADGSDRADHLVALIDSLLPYVGERDNVTLAWDFTIASQQSLSGRALAMRAEAYASVGDAAPRYVVDSVRDDGAVRAIEGSLTVANFLTADGGPGTSFDLSADGVPVRNVAVPDVLAPFLCLVPIDPDAATPVVVYGHGLLGSRQEINGLQPLVAQGAVSICATDEIGMSTGDIGNVAAILGDMSTFNTMADRMQQGLLNMQFLGRAINHPDGFAAHEAFLDGNGAPAIAPGRTAFLGNSQGGILGGAASALSTEWTNVVLGVPGINYSLLLTRSSDWPEFQAIFETAYTGDIDRVLALQLAQLLWDRGENNAYVQHLTAEPFPGIEAKLVLLIGAFGDHQVTNVATDVLARTIGAIIHTPALGEGRSPDLQPFFGIAGSDAGTIEGSAYVMWDYGNPPPPVDNQPPTEPEFGEDPHGKGSDEPRVIAMAVHMLLTGEVVVPCDGPCVSDSVG